jgi:hypothetical protein
MVTGLYLISQEKFGSRLQFLAGMELRIRTPPPDGAEEEMYQKMRLSIMRAKARQPYVYITLLVSGSATVSYAVNTMNTNLVFMGIACMLMGFCLLAQTIEIPADVSTDDSKV